MSTCTCLYVILKQYGRRCFCLESCIHTEVKESKQGCGCFALPSVQLSAPTHIAYAAHIRNACSSGEETRLHEPKDMETSRRAQAKDKGNTRPRHLTHVKTRRPNPTRRGKPSAQPKRVKENRLREAIKMARPHLRISSSSSLSQTNPLARTRSKKRHER